MKSIQISKNLKSRVHNLLEEQNQIQDKLQTLCTGFLIGKNVNPEKYVLNLKKGEFVHKKDIEDDA